MRLPLSHAAAALVSFGLFAAPPVALGTEPAHAAPGSVPLAKATETKPIEPTDASPSPNAIAKAKRPPTDPMDMLRERLAEKLGAKKDAAAAAGPNVLRVVNRGTASSGQELHATLPTSGTVHSPTAATSHRGGKAAEVKHGQGDASAHAAHWDYQGAGGPEAWGQLKPEFSKCASGTRQSPIDIRDGIKVQLDPVPFDYKPGVFRVLDNGHTVQVNVAPGSSIEVLGRRYDLVQFHFHRPSEERIDGRQFDMVVHLVHKDIDGRLAVVAVLLDRGSAHPLIQSVWNNLPLEKGEEVAAKASLDLNRLLPEDRSYFTYMGSLTTPPCSEGVLWMVMKSPVTVSADQIAIFARLYPMNARPIQAASGRLIKESN